MAKMYLNDISVDAPILDPVVQERSQVLAALQAAHNALQDASKDVRTVQLEMKRSAGRLQSHEKQYANTSPLPNDAKKHRDKLTAAALIDYQRFTQIQTQIAAAQAELASQRSNLKQARANTVSARQDVAVAANVLGRGLRNPVLGAAAVLQMDINSQEFKNLVVTGRPAHGYDDKRLAYVPNVRTEKLGQTAGMIESAIDNGTNSTYKLANQTTERGDEATGKISALMARKSTDPQDRYAQLSAGYSAAQNVYRNQHARVAGLESMAKAGVHSISDLQSKGLNGYDAGIRGLEENRGGITRNKLQATRNRLEGGIEKIGLNMESQFGPGAAAVITDDLFNQVKRRKAAEDNAVMVGGVRTGVAGADEDYTEYTRLMRQTARYSSQGKDRLADMSAKQARAQFTKASKSFGGAFEDFNKLPQGLAAKERPGFENTLDTLGKGLSAAAQGYDIEDQAIATQKQQVRDAAKAQRVANAAAAKAQREADRIAKAGLKRSEGLSSDYDDMVASTDAGFGRLRSLNAERKHLNTTGDTEGGEDVRKSGEKQSALLMRQIAALEGLAKALELDGQQQKADDLRSKMGDWQKHASSGLTENAERFGGSGVGELLAKGLKDIPGIGKVAHAMFGGSVAKAVNGSVVGQFATGVGAKLAGQALPEALEGSRFAANGIKAVDGVRAFAATPLVGAAVNVIAAPVAVAVGALLMLNSKANADFKGAASARNEEIRFGDVGNRIGTSDRLLNDIRDPKSKHLDDRLLKMRYGSADYASTVDSMGLAGMSAEGRKSAAMTAMQFSRATGLSLSESGSLAGTLGRSDASRGGNVAGDLMKFAAVIKQGVKEGVASDEMSRNFQSALERSKASAGGIVSAKGRSDLMDQIMAGLQTGNARLKGDAGAGVVGNMNAAVAGFEGKALKGKSAKQLGLSGADAKTYDTLMNVAKDPYDATRFALKNQTNETRTLMADRIMKSAGGSPAVAIQMLEKGLGVDLSVAAAAVGNATGKDGRLIPGAKIDVMEMFKGNFDKSKTPKDGMTEAQDKNGGFQTAGRQEMRANEVKLLAEKVIFSSNFNNKNIENTQGLGTAIQQGRNGIVENVGNPVSRALLGIQNGPQTGYITDVLKNDSALSKFNYAINPTAFLQSRFRPPTGRASGGYGGDGGKFSEAGTYHGGEYIINSEVTSRMRPQLDRINGGGSPDMSGGTVKIDRDSLRDMASFISMGTVKNDLMGKPSVQDRTIAAQQLHPSGLSSVFGQGVDAVKGFVSRLFGGGRAPAGGGGGSGSDAPQGVASGGNSKIAAMGEAGVSSNWAESVAGYCSRFVRQVFERSQGKADGSTSGSLFGATAIETGNLWKKKGLSMTPQQVAASGGYRPGDLVFQMSGSGGAGHVGIVTSDGQHVAENSTRGKGGKGIVSLAGFGQIDRVGRYGGIAPSAGVAGGSASSDTASVPSGFSGSKAEFLRSISTQESKGDYSVTNKRTGAMGKYQVMPQNITGWGKNSGMAGVGWDYEALGRDITPKEYLGSKQLQEKISQFQLGKAYDKHGAAGAARWWYSNSAAPSNARPARGEPTPNEYAAQVVGRMGRPSAVAGVGAGGTAQRVSVVISGNVGIDGKPNAAATQGTVSAIVKGLARTGIPVKVASVQSARPG